MQKAAAVAAAAPEEFGLFQSARPKSRFITDGRLELDNIAENAMRVIAPCRKNYLLAGWDSGGDRAASFYTIVQTAKLNGANPEADVQDTLAKIALDAL